MTQQEAIEQAKELITTSIEKIERIVIAPLSLGELITAELRKALALLEQLVPQEAETPAVEPIKSFVLRLREVACGQNTLEAILLNKACDRLDAQQQKIEKLKEDREDLIKSVTDYVEDITTFDAANKAQAERIEELEAALKEIKINARSGSRSTLFGIAQQALAPVAEPDCEEKEE